MSAWWGLSLRTEQGQGDLAERSVDAALHCSSSSAHSGGRSGLASPSRDESRSRIEMTGSSSCREAEALSAAGGQGVYHGQSSEESRRGMWQGNTAEGRLAGERGERGSGMVEGRGEKGERRRRAEQRRCTPVGVPRGGRAASRVWLASTGVAFSLVLVFCCGPFHRLRQHFTPSLTTDDTLLDFDLDRANTGATSGRDSGALTLGALGSGSIPGARRSLGEVGPAVEAVPGQEREVLPGLERQDSEWGPVGRGRRRRSLRSSQHKGV